MKDNELKVRPAPEDVAAKLEAYGQRFGQLASTPEQRRLAEEFVGFIREGKEAGRDTRVKTLSEILADTGMRFWPDPTDPREAIVDRIGQDFYGLEQQLDTGLQILLELHNVPAETRQAVGEYMRDVMKGVGQLEAGVARLAGGHGNETRDPAMDPKGHGHLSISGLAREIRQDEAERKREDGRGQVGGLER